MAAQREIQTEEVVGREQELDTLVRFVGDVANRPAALIIHGEAGIGKTTLWRATVRAADERGQRILAVSGAPGEAQMAFAGLADLIEPALDEVLPELPAPQRDALEISLLLAEPSATLSARAVSAALLTSLRVLAEKTPVLVAIDDVQWLDSASQEALAFALRRLRDEPVAVVIALRSGEDAALLKGLARSAFTSRIARLEVTPLSFGALRHLIRSRTQIRLTRPVLLRVHQTSGGNPFFALELVRALSRQEAPPEPGEPLPVPDDLGLLLAQSIAELPGPTREALLVASLLGRPTLDVLTQATGQSAEEALRPAVEARIAELTDGSVRFVHPLLRSAVHAAAASSKRIRWHRRLVDVVADVEERAHHLALATQAPDAKAAAQLEDAGRRAWERGAPAVGSGLLEHAIRLTPNELADERARRRIAAADAYLQAGERRRAVELLEELRKDVAHGPLRADALLRLADTDTAASMDEASALAEEALLEAAGDPRREVEALLAVANNAHGYGRREAAVANAKRALSIAETIHDPQLTTRVLTGLGIYEMFLGTGDPLGRYTRALELEAEATLQPTPLWPLGGAYFAPGTMLADWHAKDGDLDAARSLLEEQHRRAVEAGDEESRLQLCAHLADLETAAGKLDDGRRWAEEGLALVEESEARQNRSTLLCSLAAVEAYRGNVEAARELADEAMELSNVFGDELFADKARDIVCFLELSLGRPEVAVAVARTDDVSPGRLPFGGDKIEALLGVGEIGGARDALPTLEKVAALPGRRMLRLLALRCRGLLAAAADHLEQALETLEEAATLAQELPFPLERGRTLLALGQVRRRAKQKRAARDTLEQARATFAEIGARQWEERAKAELGRIGGRAGSRWELTPTEQRVADLVARGLTNREVAAALVVSVRAVEANLTRIYGKLGIRSRTELARLLAREEKPQP
jgi:DNA-binding CsgD family transcriptional regulator